MFKKRVLINIKHTPFPIYHWENVGNFVMVPLILNPIYTLYSMYLLGISSFKGLQHGEFKQLGAHHPKGFPTVFAVNLLRFRLHVSGSYLVYRLDTQMGKAMGKV